MLVVVCTLIILLSVSYWTYYRRTQMLEGNSLACKTDTQQFFSSSRKYTIWDSIPWRVQLYASWAIFVLASMQYEISSRGEYNFMSVELYSFWRVHYEISSREKYNFMLVELYSCWWFNIAFKDGKWTFSFLSAQKKYA